MSRRLVVSLVVLSYILLAVMVTWPLATRLSTHLPGPPSGDTGVYVWNIWVFRHEAVDHGRWPLTTSKVLSLQPQTSLTLHNYSILAGALGLPLLPALGPVATYNLLCLLFVVLNGTCAYLLARHVTNRPLEAWLAGLLFAASPALMARVEAHLSLLAAFPLPLVLLATLRALDTGKWRHICGAGAALALAACCDAYYPIYGVLMIGALCALQVVEVRWTSTPAPAWLWRGVDLLIAVLAAVVVLLIALGGRTFYVGPFRIAFHTLYTPVLLLVLLILARLAGRWSPRLLPAPRSTWMHTARFAVVAALVCGVLLSPMLYSLAAMAADGRFSRPQALWRSSPPGVDLLAFVMPNPNHPLFGAPFRAWLERGRGDGFAEFTAALPLTALVTILCAWRHLRTSLPMRWLALAGLFGAMALGPFVHVAGVNTYVPGPWALLRYFPVVELARSPSRAAIVAALIVSVLFAAALAALRETSSRRTLMTLGIAALLLFEVLPAPRALAEVRIPKVYDVVRDDPDHSVRVLELPTGIRDGTSSIGEFSAGSQFFQTYHQKRLFGGYLSRVSKRQKDDLTRMPVLAALFAMSEGRELTREEEYNAWRNRGRFLRRGRLGYVVVDSSRCSPALRDFAVALLGLELIAQADGRELYRPRARDLPAAFPPGWPD